MAYDSALATRVSDLLASRQVSFEPKAMMGGLCLMVNGRMCLGITGDRLMVRLDPAVEAASLQRPGCQPMDFTGRPMKGYVFVHPEGSTSASDLTHWVDLALAFNPKAAASRKRPQRRS